MRAFVLSALLLAACSSPPVSYPDALANGAAALSAGEPHTARVHYLNALKAASGNDRHTRDAALGLARTALASGDGLAAEAELDRARVAGARTATIGTLVGEALLLQRRPDAALAALAPLVARTDLPAPLRAEAARLSAAAQLARGNPVAAARALDTALAAGPHSVRLLIDVAALHFAAGNLPAATAALNGALARDALNAEALTLASQFARRLAGPTAALPWLDCAIAADPFAPGPRSARAAALLDLGRARAALAATRDALRLDPDSPEALFIQAALAADARRFLLARALLNRVGSRLDDRAGAPLLAARVDRGLGNRAAAATRLRSLLAEASADGRASDPADKRIRALLATVEAGPA